MGRIAISRISARLAAVDGQWLLCQALGIAGGSAIGRVFSDLLLPRGADRSQGDYLISWLTGLGGAILGALAMHFWYRASPVRQAPAIPSEGAVEAQSEMAAALTARGRAPGPSGPTTSAQPHALQVVAAAVGGTLLASICANILAVKAPGTGSLLATYGPVSVVWIFVRAVLGALCGASLVAFAARRKFGRHRDAR